MTMQNNINKLVGAIELMLERLPEPPDANCSCHISPPCNDCVDYAGAREAFEYAKGVLADVEACQAEEAANTSNLEKIMALYHHLKAEDPDIRLDMNSPGLGEQWGVFVVSDDCKLNLVRPTWIERIFGGKSKRIYSMPATRETCYAIGVGETLEEACLHALEHHKKVHGHA